MYRKFWGQLKVLGVWRDKSYLIKKQQRTARDDRRDIMPDCVIQFTKLLFLPITGIHSSPIAIASRHTEGIVVPEKEMLWNSGV